MTTDKELLELAAKAMGYTLTWCEEYIIGDDEVDFIDMSYVVSGQPDEADWCWSPLEDDGDCARMEAELELEIYWFISCVRVESYLKDGDTDVCINEYFANHNNDKNAARRLASTRVAAEIGRAMK